MRQFFLQFAAAILAAIFIGQARAHDHGHHDGEAASVVAGDIEIADAWIRAMLPNQPAAGGYLTITNVGGQPDRLVGAASPAAGKVEIHNMTMTNDVMVMRPVEGGLEIPAGETVELAPGGLHVMFMEVEDRLEEGETVKVTLEFENAGAVEVEFPVRAATISHGH